MFRPIAASERAAASARWRLSSKSLGFSIGVWLSLYPFVQLLMRPKIGGQFSSLAEAPAASALLNLSLAAIVALGMAPVMLGALKFGVDFRRAKFLIASVFLFCLSIPVSLMGATDPNSFNYVMLIDYVLVCTIIFISTDLNAEEALRALFLGLALTLSGAMIAVLIDHDFSWGRLIGRTAPNYWGSLAMTVAIVAFASRNLILKTILIGLSLTVIYLAQSRGELVALVATLLLAGILRSRRMGQQMAMIWLLAAGGVVFATAFGSNYILNDLMKVSDTRRGLGSGLTGRTDDWRQAWDIFVSHPWFGVGYQQHEAYFATKDAVHNDYLATLADTGVIGCLGYLIFQFGALCRAVMRAWAEPSTVNVIIACYLFSFTLIGLVEPTGFHTGNTISMLMVFLSAWAWRANPWPVGASSARTPPVLVVEGRKLGGTFSAVMGQEQRSARDLAPTTSQGRS